VKSGEFFLMKKKLSYLMIAISTISISSGAEVHASVAEAKSTKAEQVVVEKSLEDILKEKIIDLDLEKTDIRDILKYISEETKTNICLYERKGKKEEEKAKYLITIHLRDISAFKAVEIIARLKGLSYYIKKNVMWVGKSEELKDLMEIVTRVYSPKYGDVKGFKRVIEGLLSEKGRIAVAKQRGIMIVTDREDIIKTIDKIYERF